MLSSPITDSGQVAAIAAEIAAVGAFALDLEFVSEARYIPDLALVQVAWGSTEEPQVAAVDPLEADPRPLFALVASPEIRTVLHAAQGDLSLLADLFNLSARAVLDTQIAAAFLGLGDQVGYAALVGQVLGVSLDKGMQYTRWLDRPLSPEQLRYALDDVRYLPALVSELTRRLTERQRLAWVEEESRRLAATAGERLSPEEVYRKVGGWQRLKPRQLGALQELARWREERALASNRPPSWIVKNGVLLDLARRLPRNQEEFGKVKELSPKTAAHHGKELLGAIRQGCARRVAGNGFTPPSAEARKLGSKLAGVIQERCREAEIAPRFVASRADADALAAWWVEDDRTAEPSLPVLRGWRRELAGEAALAWLAEQIA